MLNDDSTECHVGELTRWAAVSHTACVSFQVVRLLAYAKLHSAIMPMCRSTRPSVPPPSVQVVKLLAYISDKDLFAEFYRSAGLVPGTRPITQALSHSWQSVMLCEVKPHGWMVTGALPLSSAHPSGSLVFVITPV